MKKVLLSFLTLLCFSAFLAAQEAPIWSEDFNGGSNGWTVRTIQCGNITGPAIGRWTLSSASLNGTAIPDLEGEFSVNTAVDYSVRFSDGTNQAQAQARYTLTAGAWGSNLNGVTIPLDTTIHNVNATNYQTLYFTNMDMEQDAFTQWGRTFLGLGSPTFTIDGNTLTIASSDNAVQLAFTKSSSCGVLWWWSPNGSVRSGALFNPATGQVAINSATASNGAMVINADFLTTQGLQANVPTGPPPYPQYTSELISPRIDLSGVNVPVLLSFFQLVRFLNVATDAPAAGLRTSLAYSTDDGVTWSEPINANDGVPVNVNPPLQIQRVFALPDAQGSANVRVKFTFSSDFYYWAIDDIAITELPRYDLRVNTNWFAIAPNFATPISQVEAVPFWADIENVGASTATNVNLNLSIVNNQSSETVYDGNVFYEDVDAGVLAENYIFPTQLDPANLSIGSYTGTYNVTQDSTDFFPDNNTITWSFFVTDSLFTKEGTRTTSIAPAAEASFTYGNVFYVPNGEGLYARHITFFVTNVTQLVGRSVTTYLYKWQNLNGNNSAEPAEYGSAPIAFNAYTFTGEEGTNPITIPVDLDLNPVELESGYHYIAAVQYYADDDQRMNVGGTGLLNYFPMTFLTDSLGDRRYHTALHVGQSSDITFSLVGFSPAYGTTPQVRLSIGDNPDYEGPAFITSSVNNQLKEDILEVFPNPASEVVNLRFMLEEAQNVQIALFDQRGQVLNIRKFDNLSRETIVMPVHNLPPGTYYAKVSTPKGFKVSPIVIAR